MFWCVPSHEADNVKAAIATFERIYGQSGLFASDMLITLMKNTAFLWDERFAAALKDNATDDWERGIAWRTHTLVWAARQALGLLDDGDFVECGVFRGYSAAVICQTLNWGSLDRLKWPAFWLYDTFSGLPEETSTAAEREAHRYEQEPGEWLGQVCQRFARYPTVKIIKGIVPDSLAVGAGRIAFLHVDMNCAAAEMGALERLWPKVVPGGLIVLDDFGWTPQVQQTVGQIEFFRARGHPVLELPTGQGLVIKQ